MVGLAGCCGAIFPGGGFLSELAGLPGEGRELDLFAGQIFLGFLTHFNVNGVQNIFTEILFWECYCER